MPPHDLIRAPYVVYAVKYVALVSLALVSLALVSLGNVGQIGQIDEFMRNIGEQEREAKSGEVGGKQITKKGALVLHCPIAPLLYLALDRAPYVVYGVKYIDLASSPALLSGALAKLKKSSNVSIISNDGENNTKSSKAFFDALSKADTKKSDVDLKISGKKKKSSTGGSKFRL